MAKRILRQTPPSAKGGKRVPEVAIYSRISSLEDDQSRELQLRPLREYCSGRGWAISDVYVDVIGRGSNEDSAQLDRLMSAAHSGRFETVVVRSFYRFARSLSHLVTALEALNALEIGFISLKEQVDTSTPVGKTLLSVLQAAAKLECMSSAESAVKTSSGAQREKLRS